MKAGYLRVSTEEQRPDRQIDGLKALCDQLHIEKLSACAKSRPVYERVVAGLAAGDTLVVWSVDRAYRSTRDALNEVEKLLARGVNFQNVSLNVDTASPDGMLVFTVLAAMAQWERETIRRRTREGLKAARSRGKKIGRPRKLSEKQIAKALRQHGEKGLGKAEIAAKLGVSERTLARRLAEIR